MLDLYEHNQSAYRSAMNLLERTGKAAVIHPTGTGKSIIAFKLIEDHPDKRICWLSPSKYIVETQRENVRRIDPNFQDSNVYYCTYARLMGMDPGELQALCPDFIILDEFHRCGAVEWGRGVASLLAQYTFVYQFAHMAKHYQISGIGSRHILDLYVYLRAHPDLDEAYMGAELEKLHLLTFYRNICRVLKVWFENEAPDERTEHITEFIFSGGSWGSVETGRCTDTLRQSLEKGGIQNSRRRSVFQVIFPPSQALETRYPVLRNSP